MTTTIPDQLLQRQRMGFLESAFFSSNQPPRGLPTPAEVRELSGVKKSQPPPVIFKDLNLIVKYGPFVKIQEALCLLDRQEGTGRPGSSSRSLQLACG